MIEEQRALDPISSRTRNKEQIIVPEPNNSQVFTESSIPPPTKKQRKKRKTELEKLLS